MNFRKGIFAFVAVVMATLVIFVGYRFISPREKPEDRRKLKTVTVARQTISPTFSATGTVTSANQVDLNFDYARKLESLEVGLNENVTEDQDLATLNPSESRIADQTIESPMDGTVINIATQVGETVSTSGTSAVGASGTLESSTIETSGFITIADLSALQMEISVDQADMPKVTGGQGVKISFDAIPDREFDGTVTLTDPIPVNDQNVITYTVYTSISNPDPAVRLGMSADIEFDVGKKENVLAVPNIAVKTKDGKKVVTTVVNGNQENVDVEVGASDDENTEIISGLSEGDEVVVGTIKKSSEQGGGGFFGGGR